MKLWTLLAIAVVAGVSRRCVTHHEAGALLRDHKVEGELTEAQIRKIRTGAIYTRLRRRGTGAAAALDTALLRNTKIVLPACFRRFTQYASTPQQVQTDAEAWIDSRIAARGWSRLTAKKAYDIFATRHKQAGGENGDLWLCVRDKLLKCAFEDRLQRGPVRGDDEVAVVLFSGSQSTTRPFKQAGYRTVLNAEKERVIRMGPNFKDAKVGRPIDISSIARAAGAQGEIIAAVVRRWDDPAGRARSSTLVQAGIPCRCCRPHWAACYNWHLSVRAGRL